MTYLTSATPCFLVADIGATMKWYEDCLAFSSDPFPQEEPFQFCILRRDGIEIMLQRVEGYQREDLYSLRSGGVWDAYIRSKGISELYERVRERVEIVGTLHQQPYGRWEFEVKDLNGYVLVFSE